MWRPRLVVLQPTPYCNISCAYCYLRDRDNRGLMTTAVVEAIRDKLFARMAPDAAPRVVWHAGEPTVAPLAWYERAYEMLKPVTPVDGIFALQTNGISISQAWIDFLRCTDTKVGLSIDGPQHFHDARRKTRAGRPTWSLVMKNLRRLQAAGINPSVITVLHRDSVTAAGEFYSFYRDNNINHVSFSIDETNGANGKSSFGGADHKRAMTAFLCQILTLAFSEGYPLHIREIERLSKLLTSDTATHNEQVEPWDTVAVAANGEITTFSPDFMEVRSSDHNNFCFGNILQDNFNDLIASELFNRTMMEIRRGVELCRASCGYFPVCGGGSPSNKMSENKTLESGETLFCKLSIQAPVDALREFLVRNAAGQAHRVMTVEADTAFV